MTWLTETSRIESSEICIAISSARLMAAWYRSASAGLLLSGIAPAGRAPAVPRWPRRRRTDIADLVGRIDIAQRLIVGDFPDFRLPFLSKPAHRASPLDAGSIFRHRGNRKNAPHSAAETRPNSVACSLEQPAIDAARARRQCRVVPCSTDLAAIEHQDAVEAAHRRQPVRDHDRGAPFHQPLHRLLDQAFRFESRLEVASSRISTGASARNARASATRCRSPPDSLTPRSPTSVP